MQTLYLKVDPDHPHMKIIDIAASLIISGEIVAFPTETVYGLGGNALHEKAVQKIFAAKGRRSDNPLIVHVCNWEQASRLVRDVPPEALVLVDHFWPGPLTLVAMSKDEVPKLVRAGLPRVAVRMPDHKVALALIERAGVPVAAPSANRSGRPSPTLAQHVRHDLDGKIAALLDGGPTGFGIESTILDITRNPFRVLRPGAISFEKLEAIIPGTVMNPGASRGYRGKRGPHYQPAVKVTAVPWGGKLSDIANAGITAGLKVGVVVMTEQEIPSGVEMMVAINGVQEYGQRLYELFRYADRRKLDLLVMELPLEEGIGRAVADRIKQASDSH